MDKISLDLTVDEINIILRALNEMPYGQVKDLISNILAQAKEKAKPTG